MPLRYEDRRRSLPVSSLSAGSPCVFSGTVESLEVRRARSGRNRNLYIATLDVLDTLGTAGGCAAVRVVLFGGARSFGAIEKGCGILVYGKPSFGYFGKSSSPQPEFVNPDYTIVRGSSPEPPQEWLRLAPIYPTVSGLSRKKLAEIIYNCATSQDLVACDPIPDRIRREMSLPSYRDALSGIHAPESEEEICASRKRLAYQEFYLMQKKMAEIRAARSRVAPASLVAGSGLADKLIASLPFSPTGAQKAAMADIASDLAGSMPMRRLLQGDVGSGKTTVALYALAYAAGAGYQGAVMVPTSILSDQFYSVCEKNLSPLGIKCAHLTGRIQAKSRRVLLDSLSSGDTDVVVGTHALLEDDVEFSSLGLVVIDEQQRFGVEQRERMYGKHGKGGCAHLLSMSATPIPRTLCMALCGDMDTSLLREKPKGRKPVATRLLSDNHIGDLYSFLSGRIASGESCFWVCPLVDSGEGDEPSSVAGRALETEKRLKGVSVGRLHGRMTPDEKAEAIELFAERKTPVLVSTTVIEVGIDVPSANIMIIEGASRFGLSQLHQLRGRVGRGSGRGICILLDTAADIAASEGLKIIAKCDDGFEIAEEDLRLRGAGDFAGVRQHGEMAFKAAMLPQDMELLERARSDVENIE